MRDDIPDLVDGVPIENGAAAGEAADADDDADASPDRVAVDDELRVHARFKAIHQARATATEKIQNGTLSRQRYAADGPHDGEKGAEWARSLVALELRDTIVAYVLELEPYLKELDAGTHYWEELELGSIEFEEQTHDHDPAGRGRGASWSTTVQPAPVEVVGLAEFVDLPQVVERAETVTTSQGIHGDDETVTVTAREPIPREISEEAFRACNDFCAEVGLDIEIDDADGDAGFGIDDIQ